MIQRAALRFLVFLFAAVSMGESCGDGSPDGTGSIEGAVSLDGESVQGVGVAISDTESAETGTDVQGEYAFDDLSAGPYTVALIDGLPGDISCAPAISQDVDVTTETEVVNFACETIGAGGAGGQGGAGGSGGNGATGGSGGSGGIPALVPCGGTATNAILSQLTSNVQIIPEPGQSNTYRIRFSVSKPTPNGSASVDFRRSDGVALGSTGSAPDAQGVVDELFSV